MPDKPGSTEQRKKEHIRLCLTDRVSFKQKQTGFGFYDFEHYAITEINPVDIDLSAKFFGKKINYPFLISCMTGGTGEAENINSRLAEVAQELNIPLGIGSQRQALENKKYHGSYKIIREKASSVPVLGNIGAAQIAGKNKFDEIKYLIELVEADAMVIHLNPLQEMIQPHGETLFKGLLKSVKLMVKELNIPIIAKEVGAGISEAAAKKLLDCGISGIDVAGAGGTSWAGVEILRRKDDIYDEFWDWGIPTARCIKSVSHLKKKYKFVLIGSGGINSGMDAAKAYALGADLTASAKAILQELFNSDTEGVSNMITGWFEIVKRVMFLTGCKSIGSLQKQKLIRREENY